MTREKGMDVTAILVIYPGLSHFFFDQSISSLLAQVGRPKAIEIYIDGVKPSWSLPSSPRIKYKVLPRHLWGRVAKIREYIVKRVRTKWISFWDSDDVSLPHRLSRQWASIQKAKADICFSDFLILCGGEIHPKSFFDLLGYGKRKINLLDENYIGMGISLYRTSFLKSLMPYPEVPALDWWIAVKAHQRRARFVCCREPLGFYRVHPGSLSYSFKGLTKTMLMNEQKGKIALYQALDSKEPAIIKRLKYFLSLDMNKRGNVFLKAVRKRKYFNFWGGFIPYQDN